MPSRHHAFYYAERGKGGAALVIMESQALHPSGKMAQKFVEAYDPEVIPHYVNISKMVHKTGAKIFGQLTHAGHTTFERPPRVLWAPAQVPIKKIAADNSTQVIILTDSSKLHTQGLALFLKFNRVDIMITDWGINNEDRKLLEKEGIEVICAETVY